MILIVSNNNERTTTEVIKWLIEKNKKFVRVNENEFFKISVISKRFYLESNRNKFFVDEIDSVWFRRGGLKFQKLEYDDLGINQYMHEHQHWIQDYIINHFNNIKKINREQDFHINKLIVLDQAKKVGLKVPSYFLAENTNDVTINKFITKTLTGNGEVIINDETFHGNFFTTVVNKREEENFFPSFFQEKIEKDFEIRTFYLDGDCYSMAIFSQNDEQTKIDYRIYNSTKPNRNIPYKLPKAIEIKVNLLMKSLQINCGSIDFIKHDDDYYFLEINPVGQFGNVSAFCNYYLAEKIAEYL